MISCINTNHNTQWIRIKSKWSVINLTCSFYSRLFLLFSVRTKHCFKQSSPLSIHFSLLSKQKHKLNNTLNIIISFQQKQRQTENVPLSKKRSGAEPFLVLSSTRTQNLLKMVLHKKKRCCRGFQNQFFPCRTIFSGFCVVLRSDTRQDQKRFWNATFF
jgi:sulfite exporter TauE/SafE